MSEVVASRAQAQRLAVPDVTPRPQPGGRGIAIVVSAVLAILVDQTATATINTGLPYLQAIVAASPDEGSWILTAFNAAYYAFILLSPWMMARVGRKRLMVSALLGFSLTSILLAATADFGLFWCCVSFKGRFWAAFSSRRRCCCSRRCRRARSNTHRRLSFWSP